jgi:hypothetical protein
MHDYFLSFAQTSEIPVGISDSKKFIYLVVPKAGSATVRHALGDLRNIVRPTSHFSEHIPLHRFRTSPHAHKLDLYRCFSFVRNPYDRLYSGFLQDKFAAYNLPHWRDAKQPIFDRIGNGFNRYLQEYVADADILDDLYWTCFCPMHAFTHENGVNRMQFIGRTETLSEDLRRLAKILDITIGPVLELNVRTSRDGDGLKYASLYDNRSIELVNDMYRMDFEFFGYKTL